MKSLDWARGLRAWQLGRRCVCPTANPPARHFADSASTRRRPKVVPARPVSATALPQAVRKPGPSAAKAYPGRAEKGKVEQAARLQVTGHTQTCRRSSCRPRTFTGARIEGASRHPGSTHTGTLRRNAEALAARVVLKIEFVCPPFVRRAGCTCVTRSSLCVRPARP